MHSKVKNNSSFIKRFIQYQKERFPFLQHGLLITVFTFSAASYSHMCRGESGFIPLSHFVIGAITAILFFFLLRICDEFKDFKDDSTYRPYRAVPRGLISLKELASIGVIVVCIQIMLNALFMPKMLIPFTIVILYMTIMTKEFFIPTWLKKHPMTYMASHMVIMPLIDGYTTGLDWLFASNKPPQGVEIFLIVSFFNGIVIEVGRKIRAPLKEETGVETYSALYGPIKATLFWFLCLAITFSTALWACAYIGFIKIGLILLLGTLSVCLIPGLLFIKTQKHIYAKHIETAAGIWTIGMYLIVGATPMIMAFIQSFLGKNL